MERSGPSPLCAVVNCLWVSNPSSWRWRRARRRIAASLFFYLFFFTAAAAVGGGHSRWVSQWWLTLELMLHGRCTGFLQLCLRHRWDRVGWGRVGWRRGQQLPVRCSPLGRGRLFKNTAKRSLEEGGDGGGRRSPLDWEGGHCEVGMGGGVMDWRCPDVAPFGVR